MVLLTGARFDCGRELGNTDVVKSMSGETGTRERVLSLLLELGPSTTATLGERLGLTQAAIRRHLDALVAEGSVTTREARRRVVTRGRPARLYALTDAGLVRRIQPAGSLARYEIRRGDNHHHIVCRSCGSVADVPCAVGAAPCLDAQEDHGYAIDEAEVIYWGRCPSCSTPTTQPST